MERRTGRPNPVTAGCIELQIISPDCQGCLHPPLPGIRSQRAELLTQMSGETRGLEQLGSCSPGPSSRWRSPAAPWTLGIQAQRSGLCSRSLSLLPILRSAEIPVKWCCRCPGAWGNQQLSSWRNLLPSSPKQGRSLCPPCQGGAWICKTSLVPLVDPMQALPGQMHRGLCASGAPQRSMWGLNLGWGIGYCRPSPAASAQGQVWRLLAAGGIFVGAEFS